MYIILENASQNINNYNFKHFNLWFSMYVLVKFGVYIHE